MNFTSPKYELFLEELGQLFFGVVEKVLKRRDDLASLLTKEGTKTTSEDPWFGAELAKLTDEERRDAKLEYRYFCGFADDVFFRKPAKSDKSACFLPVDRSSLCRQTLPQIGEIIFGPTEEAPEGGRRFIWWNYATEQDRRFANLLLGKASYGNGKLEKKLVFEDRSGMNWKLFMLAKALRFKDVDYFADLMRRSGFSRKITRGWNIEWWLSKHVEDLLPGFLDEVRKRVPRPDFRGSIVPTHEITLHEAVVA